MLHIALLTMLASPTLAAGPQVSCGNVCNQQYALCIAASCTPGANGTATCNCLVENGYSIGPTDCAARAPVKGQDSTQLVSTFSTALYASNPFYNGTGPSADCYGMPCVTYDGKSATCTCKVGGAPDSSYWTEAGSCSPPGQNVVYSGASSPFSTDGLGELARILAQCSNTQVPTPQACGDSK
jgi:hypothetical protein